MIQPILLLNRLEFFSIYLLIAIVKGFFHISGFSHKIHSRPELKQATQGLCWRQARSNLKLIIAFHQSFHQKNTRSRVGTYLTSSLISQLIDVYCWTTKDHRTYLESQVSDREQYLL